MKVFYISGTKGGVGTTTVASVIALRSQKSGLKTLIVDNAELKGLAAIMDFTLSIPGKVHKANENLDYLKNDGSELDFSKMEYDVVVVDNGTKSPQPSKKKKGFSEEYVAVVRNCYISLRNFVENGFDEVDHTVCIFEKEKVLSVNDAELVTRKELAVFNYLPAVGRAIDAGLLNVRFTNSEYDWVSDVLELVPAQ